MSTNHSSPVTADSPDGPCFYCGEPTVSYAGNPGLWPLRFCQRDGTGITRYHHTHCVTDRLNAPAQQPASPLNAVTVTIIANGDNENTAAEAVHHALEYARKAGFIEGWSDPVIPAQCAPERVPVARPVVWPIGTGNTPQDVQLASLVTRPDRNPTGNKGDDA